MSYLTAVFFQCFVTIMLCISRFSTVCVFGEVPEFTKIQHAYWAWALIKIHRFTVHMAFRISVCAGSENSRAKFQFGET